MDVKAFPALIVGVVVALVLAGAVLPVFAETADDQKTIFNNDYNRYSKLIDSDVNNANITIVWSELTNQNITITIGNNDPYTMEMARSRVPLIMSEYGAIEANCNNGRGILRTSDNSSYTYLTNAPVTVQVSSGVVTVTSGSDDTLTTTTFNVGEWLFYPDNNGTYTAMNTTNNPDSTVYLNSIDQLYFVTTINTDNLGYVSGHGDKCTFYSQPGTPTYDMELLNSSEVTGFKDVISTTISDYAISADAGVNSDDSQFVPFITMVPRSIDGHTNLDNTMSTLFNLLPLLAIAGLVTGAVTWFIVRKR